GVGMGVPWVVEGRARGFGPSFWPGRFQDLSAKVGWAQLAWGQRYRFRGLGTPYAGGYRTILNKEAKGPNHLSHWMPEPPGSWPWCRPMPLTCWDRRWPSTWGRQQSPPKSRPGWSDAAPPVFGMRVMPATCRTEAGASGTLWFGTSRAGPGSTSPARP